MPAFSVEKMICFSYKIVYIKWSQIMLGDWNGYYLDLLPPACVSIHLYFCALECYSGSSSFKQPKLKGNSEAYF